MSTMEPEVMDGGSSMEGNSIWELMEVVSYSFPGIELEHCVLLKTHKALVLSKKNGDTSIDLADGERYQHIHWLGRETVRSCLLQRVCFELETRTDWA